MSTDITDVLCLIYFVSLRDELLDETRLRPGMEGSTLSEVVYLAFHIIVRNFACVKAGKTWGRTLSSNPPASPCSIITKNLGWCWRSLLDTL